MGINDGELKAIQDSVKTEVISIGGVEYTTRPVHDVRKSDPEPKCLQVNTLDGFIDFVEAEPYTDQHPIVHVASHAQVWFSSGLYGQFKQRDYWASAKFEDLFGKAFSFNTFMENEPFIVGLLTLFHDACDRAKLLSLVGNISDSTVQQHVDDGVTQTVTAKTGISIAKEVLVPNPWRLRPFRTFRELTQPDSLFILRMKQNTVGGKPLVALFECDGGLWKIEAIKSIRAYFEAMELGIPILA